MLIVLESSEIWIHRHPAVHLTQPFAWRVFRELPTAIIGPHRRPGGSGPGRGPGAHAGFLLLPLMACASLVVVVLIPTDPPAPFLQKLFQSTELALSGAGSPEARPWRFFMSAEESGSRPSASLASTLPPAWALSGTGRSSLHSYVLLHHPSVGRHARCSGLGHSALLVPPRSLPVKAAGPQPSKQRGKDSEHTRKGVLLGVLVLTSS